MLIEVLKVRLPDNRVTCQHGMPRGPDAMPCEHTACRCKRRPGNQNHEFHSADPEGVHLRCTYCGMMAMRHSR